MLSNTFRLWLIALTIISLSACVARTPATEEPRATDESSPSVVAEAWPPTWTPTAPPDTPTPRPTATPVSPTPMPTRDPELVLPDLQTLPPTDLVIQIGASGRERLLRFSNSIINRGPGTLELLGRYNPQTDKTAVMQHIPLLDGSVVEHVAGEFIYHPGHTHFHLENFARYEVWSLDTDGEFDEMVGLTDKVSYCLQDEWRIDVPGVALRAVYVRCDRDMQGISVGWVDTYEFDTPGQIVDITDLPDGMYALRSTTDPADQLREINNRNNAATVYFELEGNRVRTLGDE